MLRKIARDAVGERLRLIRRQKRSGHAAGSNGESLGAVID
jgi:hypothetical protein